MKSKPSKNVFEEKTLASMPTTSKTPDHASGSRSQRTSGERNGQGRIPIARGGGESLFALHQSGRITDAQAQTITEPAPGDESIQRAGIKHALEGPNGQCLGNFLKG